MGCDIHAVVERRERLSSGEPWGWLNSGDPDIGRDYEVYAVLANVRNTDDAPIIAEPKGMPGFQGWHDEGPEGYASWNFHDAPCSEFQKYFESWFHDAHSSSWLTLAELKSYDTTQEIDDGRLITSRSDGGRVLSVCRATSGQHEGPVGRRRVFTWPGDTDDEPTRWDRLIGCMEAVQNHYDLKDEDVRLVFFFDN